MDIAFHIGANCTDEERLLKSLLRNADSFAEQGVVVPPPNRYRRLLRETIQTLNGQPPAPDARDILLDAILEHQDGRRLVMSNPDFICVTNRIFENGGFYQLVAEKLQGLRSLFPRDRIHLYMALRDPATFVPAVFTASKHADFDQFMQGMALENIRWSDVCARILQAAPDMQLTVWCNEDTPLIWAQLIREVSGVDPMTRISGGFDLLQELLSPEGMKRFLSYIRSHPPATEARKRKIIATFLEKFAHDDVMYDEIAIPGWTEQMIDALSANYDQDVARIAAMPGVRLITV